MRRPRSSIATSFGLLALVSLGVAAAGTPVGTVDALDGTLLLERADGSVKVLGTHSTIQESDRLVTRGGSRAAIILSDHTALALEPDTELRVEQFAFHDTPDATDSGRLLLSSGEVHIRSGGLGSRGAGRLLLVTPTAKVDIQNATLGARYVPPPVTSSKAGEPGARDSRSAARDHSGWVTTEDSVLVAARAPAMRLAYAGTDFGALFVPNASTPQPPLPGNTAPGLYVDVLSGTIVLTNSGGSQTFEAGQFGYVPSTTQPPVVLPPNSGVPVTMPSSFVSGTNASTGNTGSKPGDVDCVVR